MFTEINGLRVHYEVSGEGQPVLLLHGWGANLGTFQHVHKFLEKDFMVYSIDFPGFGESEEPHQPWGIYDYADFTKLFINQFDVQNPILVGHSFGGRVSIIYAAKHPVNKVILVDSAGIKPKRKFNYYVKVYTFKTAKQLFKLPILKNYSDQVINNMRSTFGSSDYKNVAGVMQQTMVKVVNEDLKYLLPDIKAPTLLIWGENDNATPVADAKIMEKIIPNAGLAVLKNASHYSFLDKPNDFLIIIDNFLEKDKVNKND